MKITKLIEILQKMNETFGDLDIRRKSVTFQESIILSVKLVSSLNDKNDDYFCID